MTHREKNLYRAALSWGIKPMPGDDDSQLVQLPGGLVALSVAGTDAVQVQGFAREVPERPTGVRRTKEGF